MQTDRCRRVQRRRYALLMAAATLVAPLAACGEPPDPRCGRYVPNREAAALVLLASHRADAFMDAIDTLTEDPQLVLESPDLDLDTSGPVVVVVAGTDDAGGVVEHGTFAFSASEPADPGEQAIAVEAERCLPLAADQVVDARPSDLLRSLTPAAALGRRWGDEVAVVVFGFGTSSGDGLEVASADTVSSASRRALLDRLRLHDLVPRLDDDVALRFVAPGEDLESSVSAAGVERLTAELCQLTDATPCGPVPALTPPKVGG